MSEAGTLNAWERGLVRFAKRCGGNAELASHVCDDSRDAIRTGLAGDLEAESAPRSQPGSNGAVVAWRERWRKSRFEADDTITFAQDHFDPLAIADRGAAELDRWFLWCGWVGVVALASGDPRRKARLKLNLAHDWDAVLEALESTSWSPRVQSSLRAAFLEIVETLVSSELKQRARHLGIWMTAHALGNRFAWGVIPRLEHAMDPHDQTTMRRYARRVLASRHANLSLELRNSMRAVQKGYEASYE